MRIPAITRQNRWVFFGFVYIYVSLLYMVTNRVHWYPTRLLPLTPFDRWVPYLPWTGWIYILVYFIPVFAGLLVTGVEEIKKMIFTFVGTGTCCTLVFIFYPTIYPRPTTAVVHSLANSALLLVQSLDTPANSMPSQHVAFAFLSAFFIQIHKKFWGNVALIFGVLIAFSTLTTKQHYVWDIIIGYSVARFSYLIAMGPWFRTRSKVAR